MSEADGILKKAMERQATEERARVPIDYKKLNEMVKRQRTALTRAVNSGDRDKVVLACRNAVKEWSQPGVHWPDDWSRWQRALDDVLPLGQMVRIEDLA